MKHICVYTRKHMLPSVRSLSCKDFLGLYNMFKRTKQSHNYLYNVLFYNKIPKLSAKILQKILILVHLEISLKILTIQIQCKTVLDWNIFTCLTWYDLAYTISKSVSVFFSNSITQDVSLQGYSFVVLYFKIFRELLQSSSCFTSTFALYKNSQISFAIKGRCYYSIRICSHKFQ